MLVKLSMIKDAVSYLYLCWANQY